MHLKLRSVFYASRYALFLLLYQVSILYIGKLHNLARALADEDADNNYQKGDGFNYDKKVLLNQEKGVVLGLGLKSVKPAPVNQVAAENTSELVSHDMKDSGKRFFAPLMSKPSTYLSSFIIYIATIGDIVDGIDTTHDFNFFSLIYEWPKDVSSCEFLSLTYNSIFISFFSTLIYIYACKCSKSFLLT